MTEMLAPVNKIFLIIFLYINKNSLSFRNTIFPLKRIIRSNSLRRVISAVVCFLKRIVYASVGFFKMLNLSFPEVSLHK